MKLTKYNFQSQNKCHSKQGQLKANTPKTENTVIFWFKIHIPVIKELAHLTIL